MKVLSLASLMAILSMLPFVQDGLDFLVVGVGTQPFDARNFAGIEVFFRLIRP